MVEAYEGDAPYIFISYARADKAVVMPIVEAMHDAGYRVWYDVAISAASEFPAYIASHVDGCQVLLAMITHASAKSKFCNREIFRADQQNKTILSVYLEEGVKLDRGIELLIAPLQALYRHNFDSDEAFCNRLLREKTLEPCLRAEVLARREAKKATIKVAKAALSPSEGEGDEETLRNALFALRALPDADGDQAVERLINQVENRLRWIESERPRQQAAERARKMMEAREAARRKRIASLEWSRKSGESAPEVQKTQETEPRAKVTERVLKSDKPAVKAFRVTCGCFFIIVILLGLWVLTFIINYIMTRS